MTPNDKSNSLVETAKQVFTPNYAQQPIVIDKGDGVVVTDVNGVKYLDLASGIAVTALGHNHPKIKAALLEAAESVWHISNIFYHQAPIKLAKRLVDLVDFPAQVFFGNSGGEANEAAIKLARRYQWLKEGKPDGAAKKHEIVSFKGGFHGRTIATVTATAQPKYHEGFHPLPEGFVYADFNQLDLSAISESTAAVIVECIQGEGGVRVAKSEFLAAIRAKCNEVGALLIIDEIQTGFCRTGEWFAFQHTDIQPDIFTVAKAMGGGLPIGAMIAKTEIANALTPGSHGSTFGGNPIACAVSLAVINELEHINANQLTDHIYKTISSKLSEFNQSLSSSIFDEIRGSGAMIGAELSAEYKGRAGEIVKIAADNGLLVLVAGPDVLRLQVPLIITDSELSEAISLLKKVLTIFIKSK